MEISETSPKDEVELSEKNFLARKQLSEFEPKAKNEVSARSFLEISETSPKDEAWLSEKNDLGNNK